MIRFVRWGLPLAAIPALALLAFGLTRSSETLPSALIELPAPQFRLENMYEAADSISLAEYGGRVVVLNYWASWCAPCMEEHPYLVNLTERYDPADVVLLGVLYQDVPENGRAFMDRFGGDWPSVVDYGSRTAIPYGVYGVPETFIVTPDGTIAYKVVGPLTPATVPVVTSIIDSLLAIREPRPADWTIDPLETAPSGPTDDR